MKISELYCTVSLINSPESSNIKLKDKRQHNFFFFFLDLIFPFCALFMSSPFNMILFKFCAVFELYLLHFPFVKRTLKACLRMCNAY